MAASNLRFWLRPTRLSFGMLAPTCRRRVSTTISAGEDELTHAPPSREEIFARFPPANPAAPVREAWLESIRPDETPSRLLPLHPDIWSVRPRIDIIQENVEWQELYKKVSYLHMKTRHELPNKGWRPWPQKGTGRARHASIRSPIWVHVRLAASQPAMCI